MARKKALPEGMRYKDNKIQYRFSYEGKRYTVSADTVENCYIRAAGKRQEVSAGNYRKALELTISEYFEKWIEAKERAVKETTIRTNKILFAIAARVPIDKNGHVFGDMKLTDIEAQTIRDVQRAMIEAGKSTRTVNDTVSLIKGLLQTAIDVDRIITWNPAAGVKRIRRTEPAARDTYHRALTVEETRAFFKAARDRESWYYNLYCFLIDTGCRCGEAGAIMYGDISGHVVHVNKTITRTTEGTYKIGNEAKTAAGTRDIPIRPLARKALEEQKAVNLLLNNGVIGIRDTLFRSPRGGLLSDTAVNQDIARICKAAGVQKFTAHAFRDTFATRCVESGMQPKTLQEILGHTDIAMTMNLYAHVMEETKVSQMQAVNIGIV